MKPEYHNEASREDITHTYMHIGLNDYSELFEPALAHSLTALIISDDLLNIDITIYRPSVTNTDEIPLTRTCSSRKYTINSHVIGILQVHIYLQVCLIPLRGGPGCCHGGAVTVS